MTVLAAALPEFLGSMAAAGVLSLCARAVRKFRRRDTADRSPEVE